MKTKTYLALCLAAALAMCASCSAGGDDDDDYVPKESGPYYEPDSYSSDDAKGDMASPAAPDGEAAPVKSPDSGSGQGSNERLSSLLTAAEWNDLENWSFWAKLLNENSYYGQVDYWGFCPKNLVAVQVVDANNAPVANTAVDLYRRNALEYSAKTDNAGLAYCWIGMFGSSDEQPDAADFSLDINGQPYSASVQVSTMKDENISINLITLENARHPLPKADVAFIVDATGSMQDEINFLISDLGYIIEHAASNSKVDLRTAALFYRDTDDEYLTRSSNFSDVISLTQQFVSQQSADGGGDYPEAVHSALEEALQKLSWDESARARIAFLVLDAPAHHSGAVIESLQKSIALFAKNGIKIIPVAASGIDKDCEFMLRFFGLATGGSYVFITNDSGIGESHIEASVGDHKVEILADLMVRLINKYVE